MHGPSYAIPLLLQAVESGYPDIACVLPTSPVSAAVPDEDAPVPEAADDAPQPEQPAADKTDRKTL